MVYSSRVSVLSWFLSFRSSSAWTAARFLSFASRFSFSSFFSFSICFWRCLLLPFYFASAGIISAASINTIAMGFMVLFRRLYPKQTYHEIKPAD